MVIAGFEKVSPERFGRDLKELLDVDDDLYDRIVIPARATKGSAGYDFHSPVEVTLEPSQTVRIPTGIRCRMDDGYVLQIYPRSSLGFRYQLCLLNSVGIIDSDYYHAENEGHIIVGLVNRGDKPVVIRAGDRFVQGIFTRYYLAQETENENTRSGGFGSTDS